MAAYISQCFPVFVHFPLGLFRSVPRRIGNAWLCLYIARQLHHSRLRGLLAVMTTSTSTLRIEPVVKDALRVAADGEHRSISNMVEVLIRNYCRSNGITIAEAQARSLGADSRTSIARPSRERATH